MKVRFVFAQFQIRVSCFFLKSILYMYNRLSRKDVFQPVIHVARKKIQVLPEPMTFWLQETRSR